MEGNQSGVPATPFRAVLFDCDGVLVDSESITNGVMTAMIQEVGIPWSREQVFTHFYGKFIRDHLDELGQLAGRPLPETWHEEFMRRRDEALAAEVEPIPGAAALLQRLRAEGIPFAVASGADRGKMRITLGRTGLLPLVDGNFFGADQVARSKPAPDVYLLALQHLQMPADAVLVIEDSPTGIAAGRAAGARVCGLEHPHTRGQLLAAGAQYVVQHLDEVPAVLGLAPR